ncbi:unnamed protein product [Ilex paraguariensis]|uniref:Uncharacterized protein n=1 Tax=Ilex paraguariensis TaxID=185542 RepID=A0ABC8TGE6_9AQUA
MTAIPQCLCDSKTGESASLVALERGLCVFVECTWIGWKLTIEVVVESLELKVSYIGFVIGILSNSTQLNSTQLNSREPCPNIFGISYMNNVSPLCCLKG